MSHRQRLLALTLLAIITVFSCKKEDDNPGIYLQLMEARVGASVLTVGQPNINMPFDRPIYLTFSTEIDQLKMGDAVFIRDSVNTLVPAHVGYGSDYKTLVVTPDTLLHYLSDYSLEITEDLAGAHGETFPGIVYQFSTQNGILSVEQVSIDGVTVNPQLPIRNVDLSDVNIDVLFSNPIDTAGAKNLFSINPSVGISCVFSDGNKRVTLSNIQDFQGYKKYFFIISSQIKAANGFTFNGYVAPFYTELDSSLKFPLLSDEDLLTLIQHQTFRYFYDFAHPNSGMARERNISGDIVTTGGSGFGVMALIVGMDRGFISRSQGLARLTTLLSFLETCDRFHGAWPHWLNGNTGQTIPFGTSDNGGDLVETSFMIEGLLTMKQYLNPAVPGENLLRDRITALAAGVEYDWFTQGGQHALFWHWSPTTGWAMNMRIEGYNETLITYVLAATSTTHPVSTAVYHEGYAKNGAIANGNSYYGYPLPLGGAFGGPLFFTHYSFLGLDPRNLSDIYANYWTQNVNQSMINWAYCADNPRNYIGYNDHSWGLTASDNPWGYSAHSPTNDLGVISPTAAVSALPYTPVQSMNAIRHFYYILGDHLWGPYGFYDAFQVNEGWWADSYIAIDQGPIVCMIENYRTGLLWNLFMSNPEVSQGLTKLGFSY